MRKLLKRRTFWGAIVVGSLAAMVYFVWYRPRERPPIPEVASLQRAYRLNDGRLLWFSSSADRNSLRYYFMSGETGLLIPSEASSPDRPTFSAGPGWSGRTPVEVTVSFDGSTGSTVQFSQGGKSYTGNRCEANIVDTQFTSQGTLLVGRLIMPRTESQVPIVVLVHGSEKHSAVWNNRFQFMLPAQEIGVFVYDKRGTGRSDGKYTQNFHLLADDAVAAMSEARRLAGDRASEFGFEGGSQAGWIIPLAAHKSPPDFQVIAYGLAEGPLAEDRDEVIEQLRRAGYDDQVISKAKEVTDATGRVIASGFRDGFDQLSQVRSKYQDEPWYAAFEGEFTGDLLYYPNWLSRLLGPWFDVGTTWDHQPLKFLQANSVPTLWMLAGKDREAPSTNTQNILRDLQSQQPRLDVLVFPEADHGMIEYKMQGQTLVPQRFSEGYFATMVQWIKTKRLNDLPVNTQLD